MILQMWLVDVQITFQLAVEFRKNIMKVVKVRRSGSTYNWMNKLPTFRLKQARGSENKKLQYGKLSIILKTSNSTQTR